MDYAKHYDRLIERARNRKLEGYSERHHVVPKCLGGSDHPDNLVRLTGSEHFVAHLLLVKMYPKNSSIAYAAFMMTVGHKHDGGRPKNKLYDWIRRRISSEAKKRTGEKNGSFGTKWITNGTENRKISSNDEMPDGWVFGRSYDDVLQNPRRPRKTREAAELPNCKRCGSKTKSHKRQYCSTLCSVKHKPRASRAPKPKDFGAKISGSKNAFFNTHWITNGSQNKRISKSLPIPIGWSKGRTMSL